MMTVLCECNNWSCRETLEMPTEEYFRIRSLGKVAILARRCPVPVREPVVEEHEDFIVVGDFLRERWTK